MKSLTRHIHHYLWTLLTALGAGSALTLAAQSPDFSLLIQPRTLTVVPGHSAGFVVSLAPLNGFSAPVNLSVRNLPAGLTASFNPNPVTPPGQSVLTLTAATDAATGTNELTLVAAGGGVTNQTTTGPVTVNFGLIPTAYGSFTGIVTDASTGLPLAGVTIMGAGEVTTDAAGHYSFSQVRLGDNNAPYLYPLTALTNGYWTVTTQAYAVADSPTEVDFKLVPQKTAIAVGDVMDSDHHPIAGAQIYLQTGANTPVATSGPDGTFQTTGMTLGTDNAPRTVQLIAQANNYWYDSEYAFLSAASNAVVHFVLFPKCVATVTGRVISAATGQPVGNHYVIVNYNGAGGEAGSATTDANGDYSAVNVALDFRNGPVYCTITSELLEYPGDTATNWMQTNCAATIQAPVLALPVENQGILTGHVVDDAGQPVIGASVTAAIDWGYGTRSFGSATDSNGVYSITNLYIGVGASRSFYFTVYSSDCYAANASITVLANQTNVYDFKLTRIQYGYVAGVVRDAETHLPITGAYVQTAENQTGPDGLFVCEPFTLPQGHSNSLESLQVTAPGYWSIYFNTTIVANQTNSVDIELLRVCTGATIAGTVVNALNQQPIAGANVEVNNPYQRVLTDTNGNFVLTNLTVGNSNSPIQTSVTASASGFNSQTRSVTIFCGATIVTDFGRPATVLGAIEGYVTNVLTGLPLTKVFIGSQFGGAATTDTNGYYKLTQVPLGANGSDRTWTVTAMPSGFPAQTRPVLVSSNGTARLDFGFGAVTTDLAVLLSGSPAPVIVGSNLTYTVVLTNQGGDAANVQLTDTLPPGVQFIEATWLTTPGPSFSVPTLNQGVVGTLATNFPAGATATLEVTVQPSTVGTLTNLAAVASDTSDDNPANNSASLTTTVNTPSPPGADLVLSLSADSALVALSNVWTVSISVSNAGPAEATSVVISNQLPEGAVFVSSTPQGELGDGVVLLALGHLSAGSSSSATVRVQAVTLGQILDLASVSATEPDPNPANNSASVGASVQGAQTGTNLAVTVLGPATFDPQTGLFELLAQVTNAGPASVTGVHVNIGGLPPDVSVYNGSGATNGTPYVAIDQTIPAKGSFDFRIELYRASREGISAPALTVVTAASSPTNHSTGAPIWLDRDQEMIGGRLLIEFLSIPGQTYVIQYSSDMVNWTDAVPPVVAGGTRVQWFDDGPPKTNIKPADIGSRYYRVLHLSP
jgi:uncharacterized repeat protein (TIGR01451 family)